MKRTQGISISFISKDHEFNYFRVIIDGHELTEAQLRLILKGTHLDQLQIVEAENHGQGLWFVKTYL